MKETHTYRIILVLAVVLLAALPVLAVLQVHWLAQLSRSERVRMQANLNTAIEILSDDLVREVFQIVRTFRLRSIRTRDEAVPELVERFEQWHSVARYPALLERVYWVEAALPGEPARLYRLIPEQHLLDPVAWPEELAPWQPAGRHPFGGPASSHMDVPVLQIPVMNEPVDSLRDTRQSPFFPGAPVEYFVLLVFDRSVITGTVLPELVQKYFSRDGRIEYDVLIVERDDPNRVVYRTLPGLTPADFKEPDAVANLGFPGGRGIPAEADTAWAASRSFLTGRSFLPPGPLGRDGEFAGPGGRGDTLRDDGAGGTGPGPRFRSWQLYVRHKNGSLEHVVAQTRRRNLAVSFGALLMLGVAIVLIVLFTRRMQRLAQQQMAFVAGVSHDLRTPITVVHAAGENLRDGLISDRCEAREYGRLIVAESRRLLDTVEQVLAFSGIAFGSTPYLKGTVCVEGVLKDALDAMRPVLTEKGVEVEQAIDIDLPPVRGDAAALTTAMHNLLQNALKYGGDTRWIGVSARVVRNGRGREIHLAVDDRGVGIDAGELVRIFEPFYRTPSAIRSGVRGNGLGLSIVKRIIEAHGGRVEVRSSPGGGSRFTVCLVADAPILKRAPVPAR